MVITLLGSCVLVLLVELPFMNLDSIIFGGGGEERKNVVN